MPHVSNAQSTAKYRATLACDDGLEECEWMAVDSWAATADNTHCAGASALHVVSYERAELHASDAKPNSKSIVVPDCHRGLAEVHNKSNVNSAAVAACDTSKINTQFKYILSTSVAKLKQEFPKGSARFITRGRRSEYL